MQRYFVSNKQIKREIIEIINQDYHHIKNVMRMKINDTVEVCDEDQNVFLTKISEFTKDTVILQIIDKIDANVELNTSITIGLGLTKASKIEEVIRRITELGATGFIPVEMKHSTIRINKGNNLKHQRLETIVKEASEQSKRTKLMKVHDVVTLDALLKNISQYDILVYAFEDLASDSKNKLKNIIPTFKNKNVLILVGPEGGFSKEEVSKLNGLGFIAVGLGPRILRLETAPLYLMSAISYELEL